MRGSRAVAGVGAVARLLVIVMIVGGLAGRASDSAQAAEGAVYFPETGFWVDPLFASYWGSHGGLMTFGYPISRLFYQDGLYRQYFERAIFEHHEDQAGSEWEIQLVRLGALETVERRKSEWPFQPRPQINGASGLYFGETGHALSGVFLDYWQSHGGLHTFGYPLSDAFVEGAPQQDVPRVVQYFERGRLEYHPENAGTPYEVLLGHLGQEELDAREVPPIALARQEPTAEARDAPPIGPLPIGEPATPGCGFNLFFWGDVANQERNLQYLDLAAASGCEWVRLYFSWAGLEPSGPDDLEHRVWPYLWIVQHARAAGLKLLVAISDAPAWARPDDPGLPADPQAFASFLSRFIPRFNGQVAAWQIWNEPNLVSATNGKIDPYGIYTLLKAAYPAVKTADPDALVVFPGLAPTGVMVNTWAMDDAWYLEAILAINGGEVAQYFDVLGVQAYGAGNDPDTFFPGNLSSHAQWVNSPEFYFRHLERLHSIMLGAGLGDKPVWIGEMGWPVGYSNAMYGFGAYVTPQLQAQYLVRAYEIIRTEWHWVEVAIVWHLNTAAFGPDPSGFANFSLTDADGDPGPAYKAIAGLVAEWRAAAGQ